MSPKLKKKGRTVAASVTITLTDEENEYMSSLKTEEDAIAFFLSIAEYRDRAQAVLDEVSKGQDNATRQTIQKMYYKVQREAGEVAALTYLMEFYPTLNEGFYDEVKKCFETTENPKLARRAMYKTFAWKKRVKLMQQRVQYPFHK